MGQAAVIWVTARFRAAPGQAEALVPLLAELAAHSRDEPGCAGYVYLRDGDAFSSVEQWADAAAEAAHDAAAEAAHNDSDFLRAILKRILPLLDGRPQVTRWDRVA